LFAASSVMARWLKRRLNIVVKAAVGNFAGEKADAT
jgi:hypothetical protein